MRISQREITDKFLLREACSFSAEPADKRRYSVRFIGLFKAMSANQSTRWPEDGEKCAISYQGTIIFATWSDREGLPGGPGAWIYYRNGSFLALHNQVDKWWQLSSEAAILSPKL